MLGLHEQQCGMLYRGSLGGWIGRLPLLIGALICCAAGARADSVVDGNFQSSGFSSGYTVSTTCNSGSPFGAGYYFIGTNPSTCNAGWVSMSDPTDTGLNMMIVNNSNAATPPVVWSETLTTTPGTAYTFTFWLGDIDTSSYNSSPATLEFLVDTTVVSGCTGYSSTTPGGWVQETCNYTSGASTSETLELIDTNYEIVDGGDFALDDISDPPAGGVTPEPSSAIGFTTGLLAIMFVLQRRWRVIRRNPSSSSAAAWGA
jgi:hypothetical protein